MAINTQYLIRLSGLGSQELGTGKLERRKPKLEHEPKTYAQTQL